jgi:predicted unusual protein kinase regulating ubiquinone biosynthesis (AarF/ABC1/UbiB family)
VKVPEIYWEKSGERVLCMEYCPGLKINRVDEIAALGLDRTLLARYGVEAYLQQILRFGFFHADPHPGNIAVDDGAPGGRLIFYDFGMMGTIRPGIRGGLLELFYAVYEKDANKCLEALVTMGVLVPTGDLTAVRRTAQFFLDSFEQRLQQQKAERAALGDEAYSSEFKPQRSKDEKQTRRKQILSSIGEDLLSVSKDQPFRFPATFTFVVRAFSVLDGIGKGLDAKFDISEIARPYARELLLEAQSVALPPQLVARQRDLARRADAQARAIVNLFKGPDRIQTVDSILTRLESGAFKPRVRALEVERAVERLRAQNAVTQRAVLACTALNVGAVMSVATAVPAAAALATACFVAAGFCTLLTAGAALKLAKLDKKEKQLVGAA